VKEVFWARSSLTRRLPTVPVDPVTKILFDTIVSFIVEK
jgi:hypothetical protein